MSGHTPRRLKVHHDHGWLVISDDTDDLYIKVAKGLGASVDKDKARRLVAAWNALDGIPTTEIESAAQSGSISYALAKVIAQRDELFAALKSLMEMLDDEIQASTDEQLAFGLSDPNCPEHVKSELKIVIACRAAIAKVEQP